MDTEKQQKKQLILEAAFTLFLEKGYTHTRMAEIAAGAGFAKATLYDYFKSKEALFDELLTVKIVRPYRSLAGRLDPGGSCEAQIRQYLHLEMDLLTRYREGHNFLPAMVMHAEYAATAVVAEVVHMAIHTKYTTLCRLIRQGIEAGEFPDQDEQVSAACIVGASNFFLACICKSDLHPAGFRFPVGSQAKQQFFDYVLGGLKSGRN